MHPVRALFLALILIASALGLYYAVLPSSVQIEEKPEASLAPGQERLALPPMKRTAPSDARNHSSEIETFRRLANDTFSRLPTVEQFAANPRRETHFTPTEVLEDAPLMAKLALALKENPALIPDGIAFYDKCARQETLMIATRAVCLRDLRFWTSQNTQAATLREGEFDPHLWAIVKHLPAGPF
ncbi:hypothetical protein K2X33_10160 [bacterium]|nr:hypothetical protein [bacterium]